MNSFINRKIGTLGRVVTGKTPSTAKVDYFTGPYPFITIPDLDGRVIIDSSVRTLSQAGADAIKSSLLPAGSVMMSCIATVGKCGITSRTSFTNQQINSVIPNSDVDSQFLYYVFREIGHELKLSGGGGSVYTNVSKSRFSDIEVCVPPLPEQRAIAATLGALDNKIELNRRMNETLEAMARALFRDWFVDFGPTRAKMAGTAPYLSPDLWSLFPDRLDDEGKPEGWEVFKLEQIVEHHTKTLTPTKMADAEVEHFSLPAFDKGQTPAIDHGTTIKSNKTLVPPEAILLSKLNPEIPRIWMPETQSRLQQVSSTEFLAYTAKGGAGRSLLFCLFSDRGFREMLHGMVTGTSKSHQRISPPSLLGRDVITGTPEMFGSFEQLVAPFLERVRSNRAESRTLAHTRDLLLPRLMSGELRIAPAECIAEEVL